MNEDFNNSAPIDNVIPVLQIVANEQLAEKVLDLEMKRQKLSNAVAEYQKLAKELEVKTISATSIKEIPDTSRLVEIEKEFYHLRRDYMQKYDMLKLIYFTPTILQ